MVDLDDIQDVVQESNTWLYEGIKTLTKEQTEIITNNVEASNKKQTKILGGLSGVIIGGLLTVGVGLGIGQYKLHSKVDLLGLGLVGVSSKTTEQYKDLSKKIVLASAKADANGRTLDSYKGAVDSSISANQRYMRDLTRKASALEKKLNNVTRQAAGTWKAVEELSKKTESINKKTESINKNVDSLKPKPEPILVTDSPKYDEIFDIDGNGPADSVRYDSKSKQYLVNKKAVDGSTLLAMTLAPFGNTTGKAPGFIDTLESDEGINVYDKTNFRNLDTNAPINLVAKLMPTYGGNYGKDELIGYFTRMSLARQQAREKQNGNLEAFNQAISPKENMFRTFFRGVTSPIDTIVDIVTGETTNKTYSKNSELNTQLREAGSEAKQILHGDVTSNDIRKAYDTIDTGLDTVLNQQINYKR